MKKGTLLALSILCSFLIFSQKRVFTYNHPGLLKAGFYSTCILSEENDGFLLSLINRRSLKRVLVNKEGRAINLLQQFVAFKDSSSDYRYSTILPDKLENLYARHSVIGGSYANGHINEILRNKVSYDFVFIETNLSNGEIKYIDTVKSSFSEKIISCKKNNNKLYLLTYINNTNNLVVYEKELQKPFVKTMVTIEVSAFGKISNKLFAGNIREFSDIFDKKNFAVYENNLRYPAYYTSVRTKAYIHKNRVIFTVNSNTLDTYLITVSLDDFSYTINSFDQDTTQSKNSGPATTSSFLIDSLLVTCHSGEKKLHLNVFNTESKNLLHSFKIDKNNISDVSATPINKTGSFFSKSDVSTEDFDKFYKTAVTNELSVSGYTDRGKLCLSFATPFKHFINASNLLSIVTTVAGTYFINASPNNYGFIIAVFGNAKTPTYVGFDATLDLKSYDFSDQTPNFTVWDRISSFLKTNNLEMDDCLFFYLNNYYYIGYFFPDTDKYLVYRFSEKGIEE